MISFQKYVNTKRIVDCAIFLNFNEIFDFCIKS